MNPVLLKPGTDRRSHVVLNGRPAGSISSSQFAGDRRTLAEAAFAAYADLAVRFDVVVCEGAGSPTEINLRANDFVNMGLARHAGMPVVVVGDIDRGGLYAALYGTLALLEPDDQRLICGFVVNKFRGDGALLDPANREIARLTGRPVLGVVPWSPNVWLDSEDSLDVAGRGGRECEDPLRVSVVRLQRISNFTDVDALGLEPDVEVRMVARPADVADADLIVLPGTRATMSDLAWLRQRGLDEAIASHAAAGRPVLGICGGFQMLGSIIDDPYGVEGPVGTSVAGLALLDTRTVFAAEKVVRLSAGVALGADVCGYEIHHGVVTGEGDEFAGGLRRGHVFGTMWHGSLESDRFRHAFLAEVASMVGHVRLPSGVSFKQARQRRLDHLADLIEQNVDIEALLRLIEGGPPPGLLTLPPG
jgi:adenosylcobyric acid synthase